MPRPRPLRVRRAALVLGLAATGWSSALAGAAPVPAVGPLRVVHEQTLAPELRFAQDLRWAGPDSVTIAAGPAGLVEQPLVATAPFRVLYPPATGRGAFDHPIRLGVAGRAVAVGAPFFAVGWLEEGASTPEEPALGLDFIADLDVLGDELLVLGARRDGAGEYCPDGALAWRIDRRRPALTPAYFTVSPSAKVSMGSCGIFDIGAVRYLPDGSYVVLPGVEPGVHRYSRSGRLERVFDTASLGLDTDCRVADEQRGLFMKSDIARHRFWINRRRVADELIPWDDGFAVVLREHREGRTGWTLAAVAPDGRVESGRLPFDSESPWSHLRADVRGDRIVFLIFERGPEAAAVDGRLIVAERP